MKWSLKWIFNWNNNKKCVLRKWFFNYLGLRADPNCILMQWRCRWCEGSFNDKHIVQSIFISGVWLHTTRFSLIFFHLAKRWNRIKKQNKTKQNKNTVISYNMAFNKVMVGLKKFTSSNAKLYVYYTLLNFLESFFRSAMQ